MANARLTMKLYVLEDLKDLPSQSKKRTEAITPAGQLVGLYVDDTTPQRYSTKIRKTASVSLTNHRTFTAKSGLESVGIGKNTKVFQTANLNIGDLIPRIQEYYTSPTVTIDTVMISPKKTRVAVTGKVTKVFDEQSSATWSRREFNLESGPNTVRVKLWNDKTSLANEDLLDKDVCIQNVEVDEYEGIKSLKSTMQTDIVVQVPPAPEIDVVGVDVDDSRDTADVLCDNGDIITVPRLMLLQLHDGNIMDILPAKIRLDFDEKTVINMTLVL